MKLFDEHIVLRVLLLIVAVLFSVLGEDIFSFKNEFFWIPYVVSIAFLVFVALFYTFSSTISFKRMRQDVEIQTPVVPSSDESTREKLADTQALVNLVFSSNVNCLWAYDIPTGKIQWSPRVAELFGIKEEALGDDFKSIRDLFFETDWENFTNIVNLSLDTDQEFSANLRPIHTESTLTITGKPQRNIDGRPVRIAGSIVVKQNSFVHLQDIYRDELTGLRNRCYFQEHILGKTNYSKKHADAIFAIILVDLEHFGNINEMYSEKTGNAVLKITAERLRIVCGKDDCVARLGADLFGIIIHDVEGKESRELIEQVTKIHSKIKLPILIYGKEMLVGASVAVLFSSDVDKSEDLMSNAMMLLRNLKTGQSRGSIRFFTSGIREKAMHLYKMEFELRKAILSNSFTLVYQPVVDIFNQNRVDSFEALVRWNDLERGSIPPSEFIPIAEDSGLIVPLGELILRESCKQAKAFVDAGYPDLKVAVNFSARQFAQENLIDNLCSVLKETNLNPRNLKIEITEYTAMNDSEKTVNLMRHLTNMGLEISIDDFGTGFSSLSYLKRFPVHTLKIDKSFVDSLIDKEGDVAFVKVIIGIAKSLNLDLIAEGVETKEQLDFLYKEGCRHVQGYYFSKPLQPHLALEYLKKQNFVA